MEAFDDPGEVFDTLMGLRDDVRVEQVKLMGLNELVTQVEEEIAITELVFMIKFDDNDEACMDICLVADLEAVGEVEGVVKCLEHMRVIVACDAVMLRELETLVGRAQVGVSLKASFVADMDVKDYALLSLIFFLYVLVLSNQFCLG
nr:hypothetical protein [Tanacetum cinerariifolium]